MVTSSPLSSSREVTARLYSSLQQSREQEVKHHQGETHRTLPARQVSFKDTPPLVTMTTDQIGDGLRLCSSSDLRISAMEEVESEPEPITEKMELLSKTKLQSGHCHIEEMENVRSHLQTILRARETDTHELPSDLQYIQDKESDSSGLEELFPRYSRLRADFDSAHFHSVSELQVIRESLERERSRRKHSEQQLLAVQSTALELQQQLSLAVSADRKKDIMIEQLDKTLEKVVEGWRRHEREKSEGVRRLQEEKEAAESSQQKQREAMACLEKNLSEAAEMLEKEQKRMEDLQNSNKLLEFDMAELQVSVGELEQEVQRLRAELEEKKAEVERLQTHSLDLQQQLQQHNLESKHTHEHLQQELKLLTQQLETERERVGQEVQLHEETQSRLQQLQQDLEETRRERDTARVDRALDQARFEAQRSQWDVELRLVVEQQVTERLAAMQEENANATARLREQHRKQLLDLSARHEREFSVQSDEFRLQLKERDDRQHQLTLDFNNKLTGLYPYHYRTYQNHTHPFKLRTLVSAHFLQAVVLQLCRDRERGIRGKGDSGGDRGRVESDFSLLNHSQTFSPLEPVLDDTHLTAGHDLWDRSVGAERHLVNNGNDGGRVQTEKERVGEMSQSGDSTHFHTQELYSDMNLNRIHSDHQVNRQQFPNSTVHPSVTPNPTLRPNQTHSSTDIRANHSSDKGAGRCNTGTRAPPTEEQTLRAPPPVSKTSSCDKRQNELQYYIAKLLERSPGEPLEEHQVELNKTRAETQSTNSGVSSQVESKLEQLADLLHLTLPPTHTTQQLQQLLNTIIRSGETCSDPVRSNLDHRLAQHDRRETCNVNLHLATRRARPHEDAGVQLKVKSQDQSNVNLHLATRRARPHEDAGVQLKVKSQDQRSMLGDE
ncbi:centrobin isoform X2 [Silurus asotus]|uniref:Centrobin isoform X2 n=1 Tax=Silurus asotus TaxID=30991 RepID=A0AAD5A4W1_SILAS|nr:centrobin isoform X2 [Silurus asotus]